MAANWPVKVIWSILLCLWVPDAHAGGSEDGHGSGLSEVVEGEDPELVLRTSRGAEVFGCDV